MKISLIIPTYNEKDNIYDLLLKLKEEFLKNKIDNEIIVVDDNSPDGTGQILEKLKIEYLNLKVIHRSGKLGLSSAVLEGFNIADGDILGVMDADLSHPVSKIGEMYKEIINGADFVVGSRYVKGGKIEGWNLYRKILSRGAIILAKVFTSIKDPMSGFFMFKKELIKDKIINPKGFKILLELLVKLDYKNIIEIPIIFTNRTVGNSKAGVKEIIFYLQNLFGYISLNKRIKNCFNTPKGLFVIVFLILIIARLIYLLFPTKIAWDASVYIGMAEYMLSFGKIGLWEYFRPPVLPILFSIGGYISLPIIIWAQFLTFLASILSLWLVYKIGEKIGPFIGVFASIALGVSTIFFSFSNTQMTEVFGVFFSLLALYFFFVREYYFTSGLLVGICFLARFPYGLLALVFGLSLFYFNWKDKNLWRQFLNKLFYFSIGFLSIVFLYLFSNYFFYGDLFSPLIAGIDVISGSIWIYKRAFGFYENIIFLQNPLFIFSIITIFMSFFFKFFSEKRYIIYILFTWIIVFFIYFVNETHKEIRYIVTIFPALSLLSGISLSYFYKKYKKSIFILIVLLIVITFNNMTFFVQSKSVSGSFKNFYSFLNKEDGKTVITSSPMIVVYSPVRIIPAYDRWEFFKNIYERDRLNADFLLIDSCELYVCPPQGEVLCKNYKKEVLEQVYTNENVIYDNNIGTCHQIIAKIRK